jgi:hypothetical protein
MRFPKDTLNPLHDTGMTYKSSCELITSTFDMGAASLPKFFKDITLATRNLNTSTYVGVDYQLDKDINGSTWTPAGKAWRNPEDIVKIVRGGARRIRVRLTPTTSDADNPPVIEATVLKAFARTPYKRQFNVRIKASDYGVTRSGLMDFRASELTNFLRDAATNAKPLYMRSVFDDMDDMWVIVEPPSVFREFANLILGKWGGQIAFSIREV